ncbi:MAG: type VI secretion system ImpA family N-terminal domain-containing protein, partial [Pseudomonadota bacterium]
MGSGGKAEDQIFDPKSVNLTAELATIDALLKRTRDARLLTLRAQWSVLAGNMETMAESIVAMADLLEAMPEDAHPGLDDGPADRLEAINDLTQVGAMILPLRYYDIANSGASRRRMMVCNGDVTPHDGEDDLSIDDMVANLIDRGEETENVHGHLSTVLEAISRIQTACLTASKPHTP